MTFPCLTLWSWMSTKPLWNIKASRIQGLNNSNAFVHSLRRINYALGWMWCLCTILLWLSFNCFFFISGVREKDVLCDLCGQAFCSEERMKSHRHLHNEHYKNRIRCPHCTYTTHSKSNVKRHMKSHHAALPQADSLIIVKNVPLGSTPQTDNYVAVRPVRRPAGPLGSTDPPREPPPAPAPPPPQQQAPQQQLPVDPQRVPPPPPPDQFGYMRLDPRTQYVLPFGAL